MRYGNDFRAIFYQWPKLGLDVEADIQILKGIYCLSPQVHIVILVRFPLRMQMFFLAKSWNVLKHTFDEATKIVTWCFVARPTQGCQFYKSLDKAKEIQN